jgi:hypothetical protein
MKYHYKNVFVGFCIFLGILATLYLVLTYWTNCKYKDNNIIIVKDITANFDSRCFEIIAISKQKRFFKLTLNDPANNQKVLLPVLSPKYSFVDNTWRTRIFIRAFANGNISIVPNSTAKPEKFFSVSAYPQYHDVKWSISSNNANFRKIPTGKEAICTIIIGTHHDAYYSLESMMDENILITH